MNTTLAVPVTSPAHNTTRNPLGFLLSAAGAAVLLTFIAAAPLAFQGCSATPEAIAYHTLNDTRLLVDGAERAYADAVAQGNVSQARQDEADDAIVKFHAAYKLAVVSARQNLGAPTPDALQRQADALVKLLLAFSKPPDL